MNVLEKILEEIEEKNKISDDCNENLAFIDGIRYGLIEAKKIICSHMDDAENDGWIPVDERLPEDGETVLCTDGEDIFLVEYKASLDVGFGYIDWITAWKPLLEAYRPEEELN